MPDSEQPFLEQPVLERPMSRRQLLGWSLRGGVCFVLLMLVAEIVTRLLVVMALPPQSTHAVFDVKYHLAQQLSSRIEDLQESLPAGTNPPKVILLLGDSLMNMSVYSELLEAQLSTAVQPVVVSNLGVPAATPQMSQWLLETALKSLKQKEIRPALVVMNMSSSLFQASRYEPTNPDNPEPAIRESYLGRCELLQPSVSLSSWSDNMDCALQRRFYVLRYRGFLKNVAENSVSWAFGADKWVRQNRLVTQVDAKPHTYREVSPGGWSPGYSVFSLSRFQQAFRPSQQNQTAFRRVNGDAEKTVTQKTWTETPMALLSQASLQNRIPLAFVWFPVHPIQDLYSNRAYENLAEGDSKNNPQKSLQNDPVEQRLQAFAQKQGAAFLNFYTQDNKAVHYYNTSHLNAMGAIELTKKLAPRLKPLLVNHFPVPPSVPPFNLQSRSQTSR